MPIFDAEDLAQKEATNDKYIDIGVVALPICLMFLVATVKRNIAFAVGWMIFPLLLFLGAMFIARAMASSTPVARRVIFGVLAALIFYWFFP
jgi:hypothetical protein